MAWRQAGSICDVASIPPLVVDAGEVEGFGGRRGDDDTVLGKPSGQIKSPCGNVGLLLGSCNGGRGRARVKIREPLAWLGRRVEAYMHGW